MIKQTKIFVAGIILLSSFLFTINLNTSNDVLGKAFYVSEGKIGLADNNHPYPKEVASINTVFWGFALIAMIGYIITIQFVEHHGKKNHSKKRKHKK